MQARFLAPVLAVSVVLGLTACTDAGYVDHRTPGPVPDADLPVSTRLTRPVTVGDVPPALGDRPSRRAIVAAAGRTAGRPDAEIFVLRLGQAIIDVRNPLDMAELFERVGCSSLPSAERDAASTGVRMLSDAGIQRQWDTGQAMWIRSQNESSGYTVEVAGVVVDPTGYLGWDSLQIEVRAQGGAWCAGGLRAREIHPRDLATPEAESDLRENLDGSGWRRILPAEATDRKD